MTFPGSSSAAATGFSALPLFAVDGNTEMKKFLQTEDCFRTCRVFTGCVAGCCTSATSVGAIEQTITPVFVRTDTRWEWNEIWQHGGFSLCVNITQMLWFTPVWCSPSSTLSQTTLNRIHCLYQAAFAEAEDGVSVWPFRESSLIYSYPENDAFDGHQGLAPPPCCRW